VVSVVIPVHNGGGFLIEALESVYAQRRLPEEVIVVDDGSTDDTPTVLKQFEGRDGFRAFRKPQGGEASARNFGVERASGEYIAFLDHDDLWLPEKLERQLDKFDPTWAMSFTAYERCPPEKHDVGSQQAWDSDPVVATLRLEKGCAVMPMSSVVVRREVLRRVGPFEQVAPYGDDWLMWLRVAAAGNRIGYLPEVLTKYRWHGENLSAGGRHYDAACAVFDAYGDLRLRARWRLSAAIDARGRHDRQIARRRILQAARICPRSIRPGWIKLL
jgi:teichuronic acid biosynthesis glycosyltransferase TuaG